MRTAVVKFQPTRKRKLLRLHGRSRFSVSEIDEGWAKVRELMRKEAAPDVARRTS